MDLLRGRVDKVAERLEVDRSLVSARFPQLDLGAMGGRRPRTPALGESALWAQLLFEVRLPQMRTFEARGESFESISYARFARIAL
jgi:hypothetical protein